MSEGWSREEVEAAVAVYFDMLVRELSGVSYNKAEHNRDLQNLVPQRTRGSIERKHQNISAVLIEIGYPYIDGYKPLGNYQELLRFVVENRLTGAVALNKAAEDVVERPVETAPKVLNILSILVPPPTNSLLLGKKKPNPHAPSRWINLSERQRSVGGRVFEEHQVQTLFQPEGERGNQSPALLAARK